LDGNGAYGNFAAYEQWESWLRRQLQGGNQELNSSPTRKGTLRGVKPKKLSYKEQKEYDQMETRILQAETVRDTCRVKVEDPMVVIDHLRLQEAYEALKEAEQKVAKLYARWAELEAKRQASLVG
jgi:ATP-binding cassette subfamily F protein uup